MARITRYQAVQVNPIAALISSSWRSTPINRARKGERDPGEKPKKERTFSFSYYYDQISR